MLERKGNWVTRRHEAGKPLSRHFGWLFSIKLSNYLTCGLTFMGIHDREIEVLRFRSLHVMLLAALFVITKNRSKLWFPWWVNG